MSDYPVNIADFRCRDIQFRPLRTAGNTGSVQAGLALVISHRQDGSARRQRVYDIGVAREAQRSRRRFLSRPISIQRRAKVLRFHESAASATVQTMPRWTPPVNDPYDLPPAA